MLTTEILSPKDFDASLSTAINNLNKHIFVLFTGEVDSQTAKSWCPDCVKAEPLIEQSLSKIDGCTVLKCVVKREEYKGNPAYPYRTHPKIQLKSIPTLIHWGKTGPKERLVEAECADETLLQDLVETVSS